MRGPGSADNTRQEVQEAQEEASGRRGQKEVQEAQEEALS
jgi:hypothetical protein